MAGYREKVFLAPILLTDKRVASFVLQVEGSLLGHSHFQGRCGELRKVAFLAIVLGIGGIPRTRPPGRRTV